MSESNPRRPVVVVTGANGFVGSHTCTALVDRGASVRAVVRRPGSALDLPGIEQQVGDFFDPEVASAAVRGADAVVTTVHPMSADRAEQHRVAVEGTPVLARAARDAGVDRLVHISTAAVYDRSPGAGDVDESSALVDDDADDYAVTKRDTDRALAEVGGITRILVRPPAIVGPGETSVWNTRRPAHIRDAEDGRRTVADRTWAWVHVRDLVAVTADLATGRIPAAADPERGPVDGACTALNVAAGPATARDYYGAVTRALGIEPIWEDGLAWTGQILARRAHGWGWSPTVGLHEALAEIERGLTRG